MGDEFDVSLNPDDQEQGGFLDGVLADIVDARWVDDFDYGGVLDHPVLGLQITYEVEQDGQQARFTQTYSAGELNRLVPTENGLGLARPEGSRAKGLVSSSNAARWMRAITGELAEADYPDGARFFPKDQIRNDVSIFVGCRVRLGNVAVEGLKKPLVLPIEVVDLPTQKVGAGRSVASPKAPAPKPAARRSPAGSQAAGNGGDDIHTLAAKVIREVVEANGGKVQKAKLPQLVYQHVKDGNRNVIFQLAFQDKFLKSRSEFAYDGKSISTEGESVHD